MATIRSQELLKIITILSAAFGLVIFLDYKVYSNNGNGNIAKVTAERRLDKWNPKKDDYAEDVVYDKKSKRKLGDTLALSRKFLLLFCFDTFFNFKYIYLYVSNVLSSNK